MRIDQDVAAVRARLGQSGHGRPIKDDSRRAMARKSHAAVQPVGVAKDTPPHLGQRVDLQA